MKPIIWTIAGSDSGGGAGIQADLKTIQALGGHGCSIITALTAQNTRQVRAVEITSPFFFSEQWDALWEDLPPRAIKIGMIATARMASDLARRIETVKVPVILDPVLVASSGNRLADNEVAQVIKERLLPLVSIVTPNLFEAEVLTGIRISTPEDVAAASSALLGWGAKSVLLKGGHQGGPDSVDDWTNREHSFSLKTPRLEIDAHGTGCTLASAIATSLGQGLTYEDAGVVAKAFVTRSLRLAQKLGSGFPILNFSPMYEAFNAQDFPTLHSPQLRYPAEPFAALNKSEIGFYPIVDSSEWVSRLSDWGVSCIQLRIKDLPRLEIENEIQAAIQIAHAKNIKLFINDFWEFALKHGAYGVHLGQEDLLHADLPALQRAGLRLGISSHCYSEMALAKSLQPSYVAIGPIYPTTLKTMKFNPLGPATLKNWRRHFTCPVVAIGGIDREKAKVILQGGADAISVVSDITRASDPEPRVREWLRLWP